MTASIDLIKASDGTGDASVATVQDARSSGATTLIVDTVASIPATFMGTMGTPHTFTDPVTGETITVISEATAVDFSGSVSSTNLEITSIAPGYTDLGSAVGDIIIIKPTTEWADNVASVLAVSLNDDGKIKAAVPVTGSAAFTVELLTGWRNDPNTFVYVSGTGTITAVFKVVGVNVTDHLQAGMPFAAVQGGITKYGFITKVVFSTDTTITALMAATSGTVDNSGIANATITSFQFGLPKQPGFGFPLNPTKWTVKVTDSSQRTQGSPVAGTWYNLGTTNSQISIPIGVWKVSYKVQAEVTRSASGVVDMFTTLSTANNSESNGEYTSRLNDSASTDEGSMAIADGVEVLTSATTYYLNAKTGTTSMTGLYFQGGNAETVIKAVCAYL